MKFFTNKYSVLLNENGGIVDEINVLKFP